MASLPIALIVGASRGLGLGLVREYLTRNWCVIATVRSDSPALRELSAEAGGRLEIEAVDIVEPEQIQALRTRLEGRRLDLLFVSAGISNDRAEKVGDVAAEEFARIMVTNALSPLRAIEKLIDLVVPGGTVAVMSSGLGSVANNETGGNEVYRASKAALNTLMRSIAVRHRAGRRTFLVIAPGWVRTDMGGASAPLDIETSMRGVADAITARQGQGGVAYVNYQNQVVPW